jgi:hypothetical protein
MVRLFDSIFVLGPGLVVIALGIAVAAAVRADLPSSARESVPSSPLW